MTINPDDLPEQMKRMEEAAVGAFVTLFAPILCKFFSNHGVPWPDWEDLAFGCVEDIVLFKIHKFTSQGPGTFKAWVFCLARHRAADYWARRPPATEPLPSEVSSLPEESMDGRDEIRAAGVAAGLAELSEGDQAIIRLHHFENKSFAEIDGELQLPKDRARVRHHRALKRLKVYFSQQQPSTQAGAPLPRPPSLPSEDTPHG